jgi:protein phosphatase
VRAVAKTHVGRRRENNEDRIFIDASRGLLVLADGMGGQSAGEIASAQAVATVASYVQEHWSGNGATGKGSLRELLIGCIAEANSAICHRAAQDMNLKGMGTTIVIAICRGSQVNIAHVGDSRAYLFRDGNLQQLTKDHSLVADMVAAGEISMQEARCHRLRSILSRSLGNRPTVDPDQLEFSWSQDDLLLLCSDGLTGMVEDRKLERILRLHCGDLEKSCAELIHTANSMGGLDNISVVVARPV